MNLKTQNSKSWGLDIPWFKLSLGTLWGCSGKVVGCLRVAGSGRRCGGGGGSQC